MKNKKLIGLAALVMLMIFATSGVSSADTFGWPVPGHYNITTTYYYSSGNVHSCRYSYDGRPAGIDIAVPSGTEIFAPSCGTVQRLSDLGSSSFGKYFEIKHDDGTITLYAHLSEFNVYNGQYVHVGDLIAKSGSTGNSTGPHLHFEMSNKDTYKYYCDNGCIDPRDLTCGHIDPPPSFPEKPVINQGLRALSNSSYAKIFTLTSSRYTNLYSNSELTSPLSSTAWTGENDEIWLTGVGWTSKNVPYARIKYPVGSSRREAYARLNELFVQGTLDQGIITAKKSAYGLYRRLGSGQSYSYGIDAGDRCYLLTKSNGWNQVLYPVGKLWRIAWMTDSVYSATFNGGVPPEITSIPSGSFVAGKYYSEQSKANGTVNKWEAFVGTLPTYTTATQLSRLRTGLPVGLSISSSNGLVSGTVAHTSAGKNMYMPLSYYFKITANNSSGTDEKEGSINVYEPPVITTSSTLARGDVNKYYSTTIKAEGTEFSMRWRHKTGSLPPGLKLTTSPSSRTATITGTPTQGGEYKFTIECSNLTRRPETTTTKEFTIRIGNVVSEYPDSRISFRWTFMNGSVGRNYSDWISIYDSKSGTKSSEKYIFIVSEGELPNGLYVKEENSSTYASKAYLKGIPTSSKAYEFTLKAKRLSDGGYATKKFTMNINSSSTTPQRDNSMSILYTLATNRKAGISYRDYVLTKGGSQPYTPSVVNGSLPLGLTLEQDGAKTYLTGTPKREGTFNFTLRVMGSHYGYLDKALSVVITKNSSFLSGASDSDSKPRIISTRIPNATVGNEWEATLEASGTQPIEWSATDLPEGFEINRESGRISGIPMKAGKIRFKIKAENEIGETTKKLKLKVIAEKPTIQTQTLPNAVLHVPYEVYIEYTGTAPLKLKKVGKLPAGLKLNKKDKKIEGTPTKAGTYNFSLKLKNKAGTDIVQYTLVVKGKEEEKTENATTSSVRAAVIPEVDELLENGTIDDSLMYTALYMLSDDEKIEGSIMKKAGATNFIIDEWIDEQGRNVEVSDVKIFVNDELIEGVIVSDDGTFTLSKDVMSDDTTVYASAQTQYGEIKTSEVNIIAAAETDDNQNNLGNSGAGCEIASGITAMLFAVFTFLKKKNA